MSERVEPPPMPPGGWALESALERSRRFPASFLIPDEMKRGSLQPGQGAKLLFWIDGRDEAYPVCERMWVLVTERLADGTYAGTLESTPETVGALERGARVTFGPEHVADVYTGSTG